MITADIRALIQAYLLTKHTKVFYNEADKKENMPYVVFNLPFAIDTFNREDYTLEIDIWDDSQDTAVIENLTDDIDGDGDVADPTGINRMTFISDGYVAKVYRSNRQSVEDNDKTIKRRRLTYTVRIYRR